jgi:adenine-specific DNA-methyltransferase
MKTQFYCEGAAATPPTLPKGARILRFLRSPVARGRILAVNAPPEVPIITAALLGDVKPICPRLDRPDYVPVAQPILAHERVTYVGEPIAAVIGDTAAEAEDLAEQIAVEIAAETPVVTLDQALAPGAPLVHDIAAQNTLIDARFETADALQKRIAQAEWRARKKFGLAAIHDTFAPQKKGGGMGENLNARPAPAEIAAVAEILAPIDQDIARSLSSALAEHHRLAFARSFAHAVIRAAWARADLHPLSSPETVELVALSSDAAIAAERLGAAIAKLPAHIAAYCVGTVYTTALPGSYRAAHGVFYTPPGVVGRLLAMAEEAGVKWGTCRALDPACGGGAFLIPIARRMRAALKGTDPAFILQQLGARLRGFDVDPFGAWLAQAMLDVALQELAREAGRGVPKIVETRDSLDLRPADRGIYDLVIGNPPYGRVSPPAERRAVFKRSVYGHANLYGLFTDAALRWAKEGGVIGYVTPTSMLSGLYYKALRGLLAAEARPQAVNFVSERDGVFADVLQETMLATYRRRGKTRRGKVGFIEIGVDGEVSFRKAGAFSLPARPAAPWLLPRTPDQAALTRRLRAMPHRLSDYGYGVSTGPLVWNRFKGQFRSQAGDTRFPVIWAESVTSDGRFVWRSEKRNHAPWFAAKRPKDDWLIVTQPCVLLQRTTAKEQPRRLIAAELPANFIRKHEGVMVENHLNMVRAITQKPRVAAAVIAALLNSATVDAAFRCINGSVAVSAFELEELPLPSPAVIRRLAKLVAAQAGADAIEAVIATAYERVDAAAAA